MLHGTHHSFGFGGWDIGPISLSPSALVIDYIVKVKVLVAQRTLHSQYCSYFCSCNHILYNNHFYNFFYNLIYSLKSLYTKIFPVN